jgi:uncharacterized protein YdiU (UPF0061 family)
MAWMRSEDIHRPSEAAAFGGRWLNRFARLPEGFLERRSAVPVAAPALVMLNEPLAHFLGLDPEAMRSREGVEALAGNRPIAGSEPLAMAYAGHQFGVFVPSLGDGRALWLGEVEARDGLGYELHAKGTGPTRFARGGDGRASLGPMVREYLGCEAMAALGIPSTRALAVLQTGEAVRRMRGFEAGGILIRVARSHLRIGSFEYFAYRGDERALAVLLEHALACLDPDLIEAPDRALRFFERVMERTAALVAQWMAVGFIHGVMNTDNTALSGETIDFGPFGWLEAYDPATCYSSIDQHGRYAYGMQPTIAQWNLARLGECLLPLLSPIPEAAVERANAVIAAFPERYRQHWRERLFAKIGLPPDPTHEALGERLLAVLRAQEVDFTLAFRRLSRLGREASEADAAWLALFREQEAAFAWLCDWRQRLSAIESADPPRQMAMLAVNPAFVLRNHLAERAAREAAEQLEFGFFERLLRVLARPYEELPGEEDLYRPAAPQERVTVTFCGT